MKQAIWLREKIRTYINVSPPKNLVIILKRNINRSLTNYARVEKYFRQYAESRNLIPYIHDDKRLPSLKEQWIVFSRAVLVVGAHGAGFVNIVACRPPCKVVEFLMTRNANLVYLGLCEKLGLEHIRLPLINSEAKNFNQI